MPRVREVIVVEGRYDKQAVLRAVDAFVVETRGFGIFKDEQKRRELKQLAESRGLIILTDSDGAGQVIRGHLKGLVPDSQIKQAFIPDIHGKEKRKSRPSKEQMLGVEAMPPEVILAALEQAGAVMDNAAENNANTTNVTAADLYALGLNGCPDAKARRAQLQRKLNLPARMSTRDLCRALNGYTADEINNLLAPENNGQ